MGHEERESQQPAADEPARKTRLKPILMVAGLMLFEGAALFALMSVISPAPEASIAEQDAAKLDEDPLKLAGHKEIILCDVNAFNKKEGRLYAYHVEVSGMIKAEDEQKLQRFIEARKLSIQDRVQFVIRSADPAQLNDPSLELIKRQIKHELNNLIGGEELIQEILISRLLQSRTGL